MIREATDDELVAFHRGIYWDAFAAQHEPLDVWQAARRGELDYTLHVRIAVDDDGIAGGIACERYPRSNCGLLTYVVVAPRARGSGLGKRLVDDARSMLAGAVADVRAVFGEVNDPRTQTREPSATAWQRLERFQRWGARVVDTRYVQPALGTNLVRDTTLVLIAFDTRPTIEGEVVREFVDELYAITEGSKPDLEIAATLRLVTLHQ